MIGADVVFSKDVLAFLLYLPPGKINTKAKLSKPGGVGGGCDFGVCPRYELVSAEPCSNAEVPPRDPPCARRIQCEQ